MPANVDILTKPLSERNFMLFKQRLKVDEIDSSSQTEMKAGESNFITTSITQICKEDSEDPSDRFNLITTSS